MSGGAHGRMGRRRASQTREEGFGGYRRRLRAPALSLGILDARRGEPDPGPHLFRQGPEHAGPGAYGPRRYVRHGQVLQRGEGRRHKAPDGLRGIRDGRPPRPQPGTVLPPHTYSPHRRGLQEPPEALDQRLSRRLLLQAAGGHGDASPARQGHHLPLRVPLRRGTGQDPRGTLGRGPGSALRVR